MLNQFIEHILEEEKLLKELVKLANELNQAFIDYNTTSIDRLNNKQNEIIGLLSELEKTRIEIICEWLNLNRDEAYNLKLSTIERNLKGNQKEIISRIKNSISSLHEQLLEINRNNRILANRARYSINNIMQMFSNGKNVVLNVKV